MDKEKVIVVLLILTILMSVTSVVMTLNLSFDKFFEESLGDLSEGEVKNNGNVGLTLEAFNGERR